MSRLRLDDAQVYEIKVQGGLSEAHVDWFNGMHITVSADPAGVPTATLYGSVADQAALHGILRKLYALGMPLIAVRHVPRCHSTTVRGRHPGDSEHPQEEA